LFIAYVTKDFGPLHADLNLGENIRPWLVFDCGGDVGLFPSTRAYSLFIGMTIVPVLLWRDPNGRPSAADASD
jgi:hypothetical protein